MSRKLKAADDLFENGLAWKNTFQAGFCFADANAPLSLIAVCEKNPAGLPHIHFPKRQM